MIVTKSGIDSVSELQRMAREMINESRTFVEIWKANRNEEYDLDFLDLSERTGIHPEEMWLSLYQLEEDGLIINPLGGDVSEKNEAESLQKMMALLKRGHEKN